MTLNWMFIALGFFWPLGQGTVKKIGHEALHVFLVPEAKTT